MLWLIYTCQCRWLNHYVHQASIHEVPTVVAVVKLQPETSLHWCAVIHLSLVHSGQCIPSWSADMALGAFACALSCMVLMHNSLALSLVLSPSLSFSLARCVRLVLACWKRDHYQPLYWPWRHRSENKGAQGHHCFSVHTSLLRANKILGVKPAGGSITFQANTHAGCLCKRCIKSKNFQLPLWQIIQENNMCLLK